MKRTEKFRFCQGSAIIAILCLENSKLECLSLTWYWVHQDIILQSLLRNTTSVWANILLVYHSMIAWWFGFDKCILSSSSVASTPTTSSSTATTSITIFWRWRFRSQSLNSIGTSSKGPIVEVTFVGCLKEKNACLITH